MRRCFGTISSRWRDFVENRRGNVAWIYALALVPLTVCTGAGIDFVSAMNAKEALQDAIDASTLAGAAADNSSGVAADVFAAEPLSKYGISGAPSYVTNGDGRRRPRPAKRIPRQHACWCSTSPRSKVF